MDLMNELINQNSVKRSLSCTKYIKITKRLINQSKIINIIMQVSLQNGNYLCRVLIVYERVNDAE